MVDWALANQIARFAASAGSHGQATVDADFPALVAENEQHLRNYTKLKLSEPVPPPEPVDRATWAEANINSMSHLLEPVTERLSKRFASTGPFAGPLRIVVGATVAAECGLVVGYMSQRVLGQYEVSLLDVAQRPRLLFVEPNLAKAVRELKIDRESFLGWIVLHELTHVFQFSGVDWLRGHLGELMQKYLKTVEVRIEHGEAGGLPNLPDPAQIVREFREGGLVALVQSREQRQLMNRIQASMAVVEGYSEHVMDVLGEQVLPSYEGLRDAMDRRRRSRSYPERILQRLLGLDLKMRQYELGKQFCDGVVAEAGIEGLNQVWDSPQALPTLRELEKPSDWLVRIGTGQPAAA